MTENPTAPMKIEMVKISELNAAKYNPRKISEDQMEELKTSLNDFGFVDPVVANKKNKTIVGGHQRTRAWEEMGNNEVPVFWVDLDEDKEKRLNISLNSISGSWDFEILKVNFDMEEIVEWGFDPEELKAFEAEDIEEQAEEELVVPENKSLSIKFDTFQQMEDFKNMFESDKPEGVSEGAFMLEMIYALQEKAAGKTINKKK